MAEYKVYDQVIEEIQNIITSNQTELIASVKKTSDFNINDSRQAYSQAFFGFDSKSSKEFSSTTFGTIINDSSTYRRIGNKIAANIKEESYGNSYQYYINDEKWLEDRLKHLDALESSILSDEKIKQYEDALLTLPDLIICPEDVKFSENVTRLLAKHNIYVQRVSEKCGETVLGLGDIVKLSEKSSEQNVNVENSIFKNAMDQLKFDTVNSKVTKYRKIYAKKLELIQAKLDSEYGKTDFENQGKLFTYDKEQGKYQADMNPDVITNYKQVYNEKGQEVNITEADRRTVDSKIDGLMRYVVGLYKEKDVATYNHITGMLSLIPIINDGLMDNERLSSNEIKDLERMIILHDVGKLVIPTPILDKKGKLNDTEFEVMQSHVNIENICLAKNDYIHSLLEQALLHHSKGEKGYVDDSLKFTSQDKLAQILPILDEYDALTGDRPYRTRRFTSTEAFEMMRQKAYTDGTLSKQYYNALRFGMNNKLIQDQQLQEEHAQGKIA